MECKSATTGTQAIKCAYDFVRERTLLLSAPKHLFSGNENGDREVKLLILPIQLVVWDFFIRMAAGHDAVTRASESERVGFCGRAPVTLRRRRHVASIARPLT